LGAAEHEASHFPRRAAALRALDICHVGVTIARRCCDAIANVVRNRA
jgi:hypothetical protein